MRLRIVVGTVVLALLHSQGLADCPTIDFVGQSRILNALPFLARGNVFRMDEDRVLVEQSFRLNFTGTRTIRFYVYESDVEFGTYTRIHRVPVEHQGVGSAWYSSGPVYVPLTAGKYYLLAYRARVALNGYYYIWGGEVTSFGMLVHGFLAYDMGPQVESTANESTLRFQRLDTIDPPALGDVNCDCEVNAFDIEAFILAVFDPDNYSDQYPACSAELADINGDGSVDAFDVEPFLELLF